MAEYWIESDLAAMLSLLSGCYKSNPMRMSAKLPACLLLKLISEDYVAVVTWLCLPGLVMSCMFLMSHCVKVTYLTPFVCQYSGFGFVLVASFPWVVSRSIDLFTVLIRTSRIWVSKTVSLCFFSTRLPFEKLEPGCQLSSWLNAWQPQGYRVEMGKEILEDDGRHQYK